MEMSIVVNVLRVRRRTLRQRAIGDWLNKENSAKLKRGMKKQPEQAEDENRQSCFGHPEHVNRLGNGIDHMPASHEREQLQIEEFSMDIQKSKRPGNVRGDEGDFEQDRDAAGGSPDYFLAPAEIKQAERDE